MERRRSGRLKCDLVKCELGDIIDMSATGMRVRTKEPDVSTGDVRKLTLKLEDGEIELEATVVWIAKVGRTKHDIGLRFENLTAQARSKLFLASQSMSKVKVGGPSGC